MWICIHMVQIHTHMILHRQGLVVNREGIIEKFMNVEFCDKKGVCAWSYFYRLINQFMMVVCLPNLLTKLMKNYGTLFLWNCKYLTMNAAYTKTILCIMQFVCIETVLFYCWKWSRFKIILLLHEANYTLLNEKFWRKNFVIIGFI